jgi:hypothetical protein
MGFWTYQTSQERSAFVAVSFSDKLMSSSFQSILLKNSKDQVNKLEQELNFGKLASSFTRCKLISSTRRIEQYVTNEIPLRSDTQRRNKGELQGP